MRAKIASKRNSTLRRASFSRDFDVVWIMFKNGGRTSAKSAILTSSSILSSHFVFSSIHHGSDHSGKLACL